MNIPREREHSPMATTTQGLDACSYSLFALSMDFRFPDPVTSSTSACFTLPVSSIPNLSMSNRGVRQSRTSISQLLQLPVER